jgi:hypothetical protein
LASVIPAPDSEPQPNLYALIVFPHKPIESDEPCLFVCSEMIEGCHKPSLGIYGEASHRILENESGDWTDLAAFTRRSLELASELLGANFVEFQHSKWTYKSALSTSEDGLKDLIMLGWSVINFSVGPDGNKWFFLKKPKQVISSAA